MNNQKSSIPQGTSYKKIGEFWDIHDLSDFWDRTSEVFFEVDLNLEKQSPKEPKILPS